LGIDQAARSRSVLNIEIKLISSNRITALVPSSSSNTEPSDASRSDSGSSLPTSVALSALISFRLKVLLERLEEDVGPDDGEDAATLFRGEDDLDFCFGSALWGGVLELSDDQYC
jgi:hypothetical protein